MLHTPLAQLLLISGLAVLIPFMAARVPGRLVPVVVGEILAGVIIGRSGLNLIDPTEILRFLAEFGFAYLMFLSGLELDAALLAAPGERTGPRWRQWATSPLVLGGAIFSGTLAIVFAAVGALALAGLAPDLWLTSLIFATTSVGVVVPTLKEAGVSNRPYGQSILVAAFLADFITLLAISAFAVIVRQGPTAELALILMLPIAFVLVHRLGRVLGRRRDLSRTVEELAHATGQLRVRVAMALMLGFVVLAETVGSELILGSFIAGIIVSLLSPEEGTALRVKLDAIGYGFFIPIFFINVGVDLELQALAGTGQLALLPVFLGIAFVSKVVPSLALRLRFSLKESLAGGFLLSARLSLIIAAAMIGADLGIISPAVQSAIVVVAAVTSSVSPMIFARLMRSPARSPRHVIVVGAGETGRSLAARLRAHNLPVTVVEADNEAADGAVRDGHRVIRGRGDAEATLRQAGAESAMAIVAVTSDDALNRRACRRGRDTFDVTNVLARVNDPTRREEFIKSGIRTVSVPLSTAAALENALLRPNLFQLLVDRPKAYDVLEVALRRADLEGTRLQNIPLPGNVMVLLVRRNGHLLAPRGSTVLQLGDQLTIAGDEASVWHAAEWL